MIPHKLFHLFLRAIDALDAGDDLRLAQAVSLGIGLAINGKDQKVKNQARRLKKRAFPEVSL